MPKDKNYIQPIITINNEGFKMSQTLNTLVKQLTIMETAQIKPEGD